jgi:hydroxymethylpyrimidine/phosphomethylpyrimidine kinase
LEELTADVTVSAVHIGMLGSGEIAERLARFLERTSLPNVVLDPIIESSSGATMLDQSGLRILQERLLPIAAVVTPNVSEASALTGVPITGEADMERAAQKMHQMGPQAVVITGGHLKEAVDLLSVKGQDTQVFRSPLLPSLNTHGTGCAFSTSLACQLAMGRDLSTAVLLAKSYVTAAIANAYPIGKGAGPVNHMYGMSNLPDE